MTEQIVDLIEGVMPGPRGVGPRGEQGLPGVNAVPADSADASCPRDRVGIVLIGGGINDRTPPVNYFDGGRITTTGTLVSDEDR